jgi:anthranilate synthase component 1
MIDVELRQAHVTTGSAVTWYKAAAQQEGTANVFLLESLSGPAADTRSSMVGISGLLEVAIYRGTVEMSGQPALVDAARQALAEEGVIVNRDGRDVLAESDSLWQLGRTLSRVFSFERNSEVYDFGVRAFFGYDAVRYIERLPRTIRDPDYPLPDAAFSLIHALFSIAPETEQTSVTIAECELWPRLDLEGICTNLGGADAARQFDEQPGPVPRPTAVRDELTHDDYIDKAAVCLRHVEQGDVFQIQLGHEMTIESEARPIEVYRRLRWRNPSPYMCLVPLPGSTTIGASPELFVRTIGREAVMRPIAGTARIAARDDDDTVIRDLRLNEKERAEHIMLVDLCRNDLGRVAEPQSINVDELMKVESYSHLHHLVSNVRATMAADVDVFDVIRAGFPAGTMTGAPKVRAMEIIETLEESRRGLYAGAFGVIGFGGWSVLALGIRMAVHTGDEYRIRASAGIVSDSTPEAEWRETLTKMAATFWSVTGDELI